MQISHTARLHIPLTILLLILNKGANDIKPRDLITEIKGIKFYKGNLIKESNRRVVYTDDENYRILEDEDILKACERIYKLWYE